MIQLLTYPDIDPQQWQALVERSPYATWFQTKEAYEFYAANPSEMHPFAIGIEENEVKGTEDECKVESLKFKGTDDECKVESVKFKGTDDECKVESVKFKGEENGKADTPTSIPYTLHPTPTLKGVIVGYITRERNSLKQFFTRRAIIIGGPLLAEDISATALAELLKAVKAMGYGLWAIGEENNRQSPIANRPIYIESRNFHDYSKWKSIFETNGFAYQQHLNYHVNTSTVEIAQSNIGKHRWKYIRLSMRDGAKIVENPSIEQVRAFYTILQDLYKTKVKTPLWSWEFFERLYYVEHAKYILVELDGKIVGGTACVSLPGKAVYEWYACGLDNCRNDIRPLSVAIWGEMQYAAENGYPLFDFMGAGKPDEPYGVRDFKAEFGGELVEHGRYLHICKPLLYKIGKWGVKILKSGKIW